MKKILFALLLCSLAGCKKDKPQVAPEIAAPPASTAPAVATVTDMSPSEVSTGMVVTISGTNFGTSTDAVAVSFSGAKATIQSVIPTQIKAVVPTLPATSGDVSVTIEGHIITGLSYTTAAPAVAPLTIIRLTTQAQVDSFAVHNQGKQLQLSGGLFIGNLIPGSDIHDISGLSGITTIAGALNILNCPQLTDVSALSNLTSAGSIVIIGIGATSVVMDKLTATNGLSIIGFYALSNKALTKISFKSLPVVGGVLNIGACPQLTTADYSALTSVSGKFTVSNTALTNLSGFTSLQTASSITISGNTALASIQGLERLNTLTAPALNTQYSSSDLSVILGGVYITSNAKLSSLAGLQNLSAEAVPVIYISGNTALNDFCPLKGPINAANNLGPYTYQTLMSTNPGLADSPYKLITHTLTAVTLTNNGNYAATADALAAVANCN